MPLCIGATKERKKKESPPRGSGDPGVEVRPSGAGSSEQQRVAWSTVLSAVALWLILLTLYCAEATDQPGCELSR